MSARNSNTDLCLSYLRSQIREDYCPECEGEGCFVAEGPGCFDERLGNYYPTDLYSACNRCGRTGEGEPEGEPILAPSLGSAQHLDDDLDLNEDELPF